MIESFVEGRLDSAAPTIDRCWKAEGDWQEGLTQMEHDWVLGVKLGETELMVIVKGVNAHG